MRPEQSSRPRQTRGRATRSSRVLLASVVFSLGAVAGVGCVGSLGDAPGDVTGGATGSTSGGACTDCETAVLDTSRFPRLSPVQWESTVQDLLYLPQPSGLSSSFTGDPLGGIFDNNEASLLVTPGLWADYQGAAEELATRVASDPLKLAKLLPPGAPTEPTARARAFLEHFGKRAYRRPLSPAELEVYLALFVKGKDLVDGPDDFAKGARLAIHALLQSPHFVYRVEASVGSGGSGIPLSAYEIAAKLSYMLWNTMPDDELFAAAASGSLASSEGILAAATRMLQDTRAKRTVASFHHQLFEYDSYDDLNKDPVLFPSFTPALGADMKREAELFVDEIVFSQVGGIREILTEPVSFINADLAAIYGIQGTFGSAFVKVDLDPKQRSGFLTRTGFLASNGTQREQHSIRRGVFVNRRVLCADLPDPPPNVPPLPADVTYKTNRERVDKHTGAGTCGATCHGTLINPAGFAFEHYDAIGQHRDEENGNPVDSSSTYPLDGGSVSYGDAIAFSNLLAESDQVHTCYARHWLSYAYGRVEQAADRASLAALAKDSKKGTRALILALTQTPAFRTRTPYQETP